MNQGSTQKESSAGPARIIPYQHASLYLADHFPVPSGAIPRNLQRNPIWKEWRLKDLDTPCGDKGVTDGNRKTERG
jgi:hypothetical protein